MKYETTVLQFGPHTPHGQSFGLRPLRRTAKSCICFLLTACLWPLARPEGITMSSHPQFKETLNQRIEEFENETGIDRNSLLDQLAKVTGKEVSVIRSYRGGLRFPPDPALRAIANYLCPGKAADAFFNKLKASKTSSSAAWAERVLKGEVELRIQAAEYDGGKGFFDRVFVALLDSAGIRHGPHDDKHLDFYGLREQLWNANSRHDAALGVLCTPAMLVKLHHFCAPVAYRTNAICLTRSLADGSMALPDLQRALMPYPSEVIHEEMLSRLHLIAMRGEIGHVHIQSMLKRSIPDKAILKRLDVDLYVKALISSREKAPVCIADEITCLNIRRHLGRKAQLVFPLRTGGPHEACDRGALLPEYPLSIAVSRNLKGATDTGELITYLESALACFLQTNATWVAHCYLSLKDRVRHIAYEALPEERPTNIEAFLDHTFKTLPEYWADYRQGPLNWEPVLRTAAGLDSFRNRWAPYGGAGKNDADERARS
jgi:hypothetical protein